MVIKTILVLPLVLGPLFSWFLPKQNRVSAQTASLVATVRLNGLEVKVFAPSFVKVGEQFRIRATVSNLGRAKIKKAKAEISLDPGLDLRGNFKRKLGVILATESRAVFWRVTARQEGRYVVLVEALGIEEEAGNLVEASDSTIVEVQTFISFWNLIRYKSIPDTIRKFLARA